MAVHWAPSYNTLPPPKVLSQILAGEYTIKASFYDTYASKLDKPMMLSGTGAEYMKGAGAAIIPSELDVKKAWWSQWLDKDFESQFPQIKMVILAEINFKADQKAWDYRLGSNSKPLL